MANFKIEQHAVFPERIHIMKHLRTYFFTLFMIASLCSAATAMGEDPIEKLLKLTDTLTLDETIPDTTPAPPTTPTTPTQEQQDKLNNDLYTACRGIDSLREGQPPIVDIDRVKELLGLGASVNMKGAHDNSPLHVACRYGLKDLVIELLTWNPDIDALNAFSMTALHFASGQGLGDIVNLLLDKNPNKEIADLNGMTALHVAVQQNRLSSAGILIGAGAIVNAPNNTDALPIHTALLSEPINLDLVTLLIRNKSNLGAADRAGLTPLNIVFNSANIDLSLCLINSDVNEDVRRPFEPFFLNAMFCVNKDIRILKALLAKGMDKNIALQNKWTPLHFACGMGCMDIAELLINEGADLQAESLPDNKGIVRTPLDCITKREHTMYLFGVVNKLLAGGSAT
jgi:ankyrin repeat protein